eukprot:858685-Alexandrium_andersonii.AAC.1
MVLLGLAFSGVPSAAVKSTKARAKRTTRGEDQARAWPARMPGEGGFLPPKPRAAALWRGRWSTSRRARAWADTPPPRR